MAKIEDKSIRISIARYFGISFFIFSFVGLYVSINLILSLSQSGENFLFNLSIKEVVLVAINIVVAVLFMYISYMCFQKTGKLFIFLEYINTFSFLSFTFLVSSLMVLLLFAVINAPLVKLNLLMFGGIRETLLPNMKWALLIFNWFLFTSIFTYSYKHYLEWKNKQGQLNTEKFPKKDKIIFTIIIALFLLIEVLTVVNFPHPIWGGDTDDYLFGAGKSFYDLEFFAAPRPFTTSLLYKVFGANLEMRGNVDDDGVIRNFPSADKVLIAQTIIHTISWLSLAVVVTKKTRNPLLKYFSLILVLLIALSPAVIQWNSTLLSESLSISLMVLLIAISLDSLNNWTWHKGILLICIVFFWIFTRELNSVLMLLIALMLIPISIIFKSKRIYLIFALFFIGFFVFSSFLSDIRNRWAVPLGNVIFHRVLPNPKSLDFFENHGLPVTNSLLGMEGKWVCDNQCAFLKDSKFEVSRDWIFLEGRSTYIRFLLANYQDSLIAPFLNWDRITQQFLTLPDFPGNKEIVPKVVTDLVYINSTFAGVGTIILLIIGIGLKFPDIDAKLGMYTVLILLIYPHAFLSFHGDEMEIGRHAIQLSIQVRLMFWLILVYVLDNIQVGNKKNIEIN